MLNQGFQSHQHTNTRLNSMEGYGNEAATLDENWLHELSCVVNCFVRGESLHEETLSR